MQGQITRSKTRISDLTASPDKPERTSDARASARTEATDEDRRLMTGAIALARRGLGRTAPNPAVGAVIYDPVTREIVGRGWTQPGGRPHAEPEALDRAGRRARGATLYVTLEPCAHHGRTPPCVDAIIAAGVARVVHGITDPDPRVAGQGLRRLREAGIDAGTSALWDAARRVTLGHVLRVSERRPFVQVKIAVDGAGNVPAGRDGAPVWATGPVARARGHMMRAEADAILVGRGTAETDNPSLDCRLPGLAAQSPLRVVLSGSGRLSPALRLLEKDARLDPHSQAPHIFVSRHADGDVVEKLRAGGARVQVIADVAGRLWIPAVLEALVERGITRLLIEGGPAVWHAFDRAGMIDEVVMFRGGLAGVPFDAVAAKQMLARYISQSPLSMAARASVGDDDMITYRRP
jgi:diaminohydroxyphosphoribosylaminopyrimidine deaminase/5-amino-6-(5-phosphoribosylamino)uracil reductase